MKISFTAELDAGSGMQSILHKYMEAFKEFFSVRNYGNGILEICFCAVCRRKQLELKQRVRMDHKGKFFFCDIMYSYEYWVAADDITREADFFPQFRQIIPFLEKRKIKDFDLESFKKDLEIFLGEYI